MDEGILEITIVGVKQGIKLFKFFFRYRVQVKGEQKNQMFASLIRGPLTAVKKSRLISTSEFSHLIHCMPVQLNEPIILFALILSAFV